MQVRWLAVALVLVIGSAPGAQAQVSAAPSAGVYTCNSTLNLAAGSGQTHCVGTTFGGFMAEGSTDARAGAFDFDVSVDYNETACPLIGTADGTVSIVLNEYPREETYYAHVNYVRVGTIAVAVLTGSHSGAAIGVFTVAAADIGPNLCAETNVDITLTGVFGAV